MTYQTERDEMGASITEYASDITPTKLASAITETTEYVESLREAISEKASLEGVSIKDLGDVIESTFFSLPMKLTPALIGAVKSSQGLKIKPKGSFIIKIDTRYEYSTSWNEAEQRYISVNEDTISVNFGYTGSFTIDWGDGTVSSVSNHTYATAGEYTVSITGVITDSETINKEVIKEVVQFGDLCVFNTLAYLFYNASGLDKLPSKDWPTIGESVNASYMFRGCHSFNQDINHWNTSNIITMVGAFYRCYIFNQPLDQWDTSNVTDMNYMFRENKEFNQDLSTWDVSNVTTMRTMFFQCELFNQPLNDWDVSSVTNMDSIFIRCYKFNTSLSNWDVGNVMNMSNMFNDCILFNQDINQWNVSSVTNMDGMFYKCSKFNQPLNNWDVSSVTNMTKMFYINREFNQPLDQWDTSNVTGMNSMLQSTNAFYQDLSMWDVSRVGSYFKFFNNGGQLTAAMLPSF
jgi:surface protein